MSAIDAMLGCNIQVPCVDGTKVKLSISPGTQTGTRLRMKGKGMPPLRGSSRGDQYVGIELETPISLSKKQEALIKEIKNLGLEKNTPKSTKFKNIIN